MTRNPVVGGTCSKWAAVAVFLVLAGCARLPAEQEARFLSRGQKLFDLREFTKAALEFKNAAREMPRDAEPHYRLALVELALKQPHDALDYLQRTLRLNPNHVAAKVKMAEILVESRTLEGVKEAEQLVRAITSDPAQPANPDVMATLARAEMRLGDQVQAEKELRQAVARFPEHVRSASFLASARLAEKDTAGAEKALKDLIDHNQRSVEARLAFAHLYLVTGNAAKAEEQLRSAVQIEPKNGLALAQLGQLLFATGKRVQAGPFLQSLSRLPEATYRSYYSMYLFETGAADAGLRELEQLHRTYPADRDVRTRLVSTLYLMKSVSESHKIIEGALRSNPNDVDALIQRSWLKVGEGKYTEAETDLQRALHYEPNKMETHYLLAQLPAYRRNSQRARQELQKVLELDPGNLSARLDLARLLLSANLAREAISALDQAPVGQHLELASIIERNWALLRLGDLKAVRASSSAALRQVRAKDLILQAAVVDLDEGKPASAYPLLEEILQHDPDDTRALAMLMRSRLIHHQTEAALKTLHDCLSRKPDSAALQTFAGDVFLALQKRQEAEAAFRKAFALSPESARAALALARRELQDGKTQEGRTILIKLLGRPDFPEEAGLMMAESEQRSGDTKAEVEQLRKVLAAYPSSVIALNEIAYRLAEDMNQPDAALPFAERATELAPDNPAVQDTMGWVLYRKGLYKSAVRLLENASSREKRPARLLHLSMVYAKLGRADDAHRLEAEAKALELLPH